MEFPFQYRMIPRIRYVFTSEFVSIVCVCMCAILFIYFMQCTSACWDKSFEIDFHTKMSTENQNMVYTPLTMTLGHPSKHEVRDSLSTI